MAVLTASELNELRREIADVLPKASLAVNFTKAQANLALQAIEDWFENNRSALSTAIDTATSPLALTNNQKKRFVAYWIKKKFGREGV